MKTKLFFILTSLFFINTNAQIGKTFEKIKSESKTSNKSKGSAKKNDYSELSEEYKYIDSTNLALWRLDNYIQVDNFYVFDKKRVIRKDDYQVFEDFDLIKAKSAQVSAKYSSFSQPYEDSYSKQVSDIIKYSNSNLTLVEKIEGVVKSPQYKLSSRLEGAYQLALIDKEEMNANKLDHPWSKYHALEKSIVYVKLYAIAFKKVFPNDGTKISEANNKKNEVEQIMLKMYDYALNNYKPAPDLYQKSDKNKVKETVKYLLTMPENNVQIYKGDPNTILKIILPFEDWGKGVVELSKEYYNSQYDRINLTQKNGEFIQVVVKDSAEPQLGRVFNLWLSRSDKGLNSTYSYDIEYLGEEKMYLKNLK